MCHFDNNRYINDNLPFVSQQPTSVNEILTTQLFSTHNHCLISPTFPDRELNYIVFTHGTAKLFIT